MKKKIFYIAVIVICLAILTGSTIAYYTASDTVRNVITSGGIAVTVVEQQMVNGTVQPYPNEPIPVMPGETVSKIVTVCSSQQAAWVRLQYSFWAIRDFCCFWSAAFSPVLHIVPSAASLRFLRRMPAAIWCR